MTDKIQDARLNGNKNSGSCRDMEEYLMHEDEVRAIEGKKFIPFITAEGDPDGKEEVIDHIDRSRSHLGKNSIEITSTINMKKNRPKNSSHFLAKIRRFISTMWNGMVSMLLDHYDPHRPTPPMMPTAQDPVTIEQASQKESAHFPLVAEHACRESNCTAGASGLVDPQFANPELVSIINELCLVARSREEASDSKKSPGRPRAFRKVKNVTINTEYVLLLELARKIGLLEERLSTFVNDALRYYLMNKRTDLYDLFMTIIRHAESTSASDEENGNHNNINN